MREERGSQKLAAVMQDKLKGTFSEFLTMEVVEYWEGYCRSKCTIKQEYLNPLKSVHGGYLFTVADTTAGIASAAGGKSTVTTIESNMRFLNAALNCDTLYAEATVLKSGKRIVYTEAVVKGEDGTIFAKGSYTFARIVLPGIEVSSGGEKDV